MTDRAQHTARRALFTLNRIFARNFHQVTVLAPCRLPRRGAAIVISNHTSALDPALIQAAAPRLIRWMMAREYYEMPAFRRFFSLIDAIPVNRNGKDIASTRAALRVLESGEVLGIFPEGRIEPSRELLPFQSGVAMLAARKNVPVYPVWIDGTQRNCPMRRAITSPQSATVTFGPALDPPNSADVDLTTRRYEQAVRSAGCLTLNSDK